MEFGTPEEDAFRRDATVNAMFFHLGKQEVVDLTGRGLKDLAAGIMMTPLDSHETFMDDPVNLCRYAYCATTRYDDKTLGGRTRYGGYSYRGRRYLEPQKRA
ncbi:hypothetical protein ANO14919_030000 [Xylariales sp. No.14919]|nr:hypothetical protein ANO14919_030000 [Xylariales sp. No.14919]